MNREWNPPPEFVGSSAEDYLLALANFIAKYSFLYQYKSIEYFTHHVWATLPPSWQGPLLELEDDEAKVFPQATMIKAHWPSSLVEFLQDIQRLAMPRALDAVVVAKNFPFLSSSSPSPSPFLSPSASASPSLSPSLPFTLPSLSRNMSLKKIHEVQSLSHVISHVTSHVAQGESDTVEVVDVGSGEGYLGQVLYNDYGLSVVGVDERSSFTEGAQQRAQFIKREREAREKREGKREAGETENKIDDEDGGNKEDAKRDSVKNVVACITLDMDPKEFECIAWPTSPPDKAVLVGLHTCGVLANAMLRLFMKSDKIRAIVDVGCCYYRKQPGTDYELMSNAGQQISKDLNFQLTAGALKLACEAVCRLAECTEEDYTYSMKSHFYRTVLETWLVKNNPNGHSCNIRGLPRKKAFTFSNYAQLAVKRITKDESNLDPVNSLNELEQLYEEVKGFYKHVNATLMLRSVMSPVLESFILLDRFLYLKEHQAVPYLAPLFDESLSPRNLAIIAFKP